MDRRSLTNITLAAASVCVALALAEIGFRAYQSFRDERASALASGPGARPLEDPDSFLVMGAGASTLLGEPYDPKINSLSILVHTLGDMHPGLAFRTRIVGEKGMSMRRLYPLILTALDEERPSLFILLSGHNEFPDNAHPDRECSATRLAAYRALRWSRLFRFLYARFQRKGRDELPRGERRFFDHPVLCDNQRDDLLESYRLRVASLAETLKKRGIPALFVIPAGNEGSYPPNRSIYAGESATRDSFLQDYRCGRVNLARGDAAAAQRCLAAAEQADPHFAEVLHQLGRASVALGRGEDARRLFLRAREADGSPWIAGSAQKRSIEEAARRHGVIALDAREMIGRVSPSGLLDENVFHDVVHPTLPAYHAMAKGMLEAIRKHGLIGRAATAEPTSLSELALTRIFDFSRGDWFRLFLTRSWWFRITRRARFDPTDHLERTLQNLQEMKKIDPSYYRRFVDRDGIEARFRAEWVASSVEWEGRPRGAARINPARLWAFYRPEEVEPVYISGVPSWIRHGRFESRPHSTPKRRRNPEPQVGALDLWVSLDRNTRETHPFFWPAEVAFRTEQRFKRFLGRLKIGPRKGFRAPSHCAVLADEKIVYRSPLLQVQGKPVDVDVDIGGADEVRLSCSKTKKGGREDRVIWLEPRFLPPGGVVQRESAARLR